MCFATAEARRTISRFRSMRRTYGLGHLTGCDFVQDAPLVSRTKMPDREKGRRARRGHAGRASSKGTSLRERAVAFASTRTEVRTKELTDIGIPRCYLRRM